MATDSVDDEQTRWTPWALARAVLLLALFGVIGVATMRGCFKSDPQTAKNDKEKEKEKKKQEDFELAFPVVQPSDSSTAVQAVKPGHWVASSQTMQANRRDFIGESRLEIVDGKNRPYAVERTPFVLRAQRPVLLTKGRPKFVESPVFVPQTDQAINLSTQLEERGLGFSTPPLRSSLVRMPSYQYYLVVLAKEPSRYSFVKSLDCVQVPFDGESDFDDTEDPLHYRVVQLAAGKRTPLPDNPLLWTSIAYLFWDEVDPNESFTPEQQRAIVDWLHWGGQLVISGPDSLDLLKGSFLEAYLPAGSTGPRKIEADDPAIAELNRGWSISTPKVKATLLRPTAAWSGVGLRAHAKTQAIVNTGGLFLERRVGAGRIVVSAIQLAERDFVNWRSGFDSFFNACLLRRPAREYREGHFAGLTLAWADESLSKRRLDARLTTKLRYFARDPGVATSYVYQELPDEDAMGFMPQVNQWGQPGSPRAYRAPEHAGGIGAWNDFSATAGAARGALREAAGVEVPGADFVVICLAMYLVALVPLNWLVFRTIGRTEWAWIAAPLIALVGTAIIVQRAQLDIGFVRAQTEIGVVEQQPNLARVHVSRYTALYTSLSSAYDLAFDNLTTLAAPFATQADYQMLSGQGATGVDFRNYDDVRLAGMPISSNSTGMVHSEQMLALAGAVCLETSIAGRARQIVNHSELALASACVVRRPTKQEARSGRRALEGAWIGRLLPKQSFRLPSLQRQRGAIFVKERADEEKALGQNRLDLEPMFQIALDAEYMEPGEMRLVARIDEVLPGEAITPRASQVRGAAIVVAHLEYAPLDDPEPDLNTRAAISLRDDSPLPGEEF